MTHEPKKCAMCDAPLSDDVSMWVDYCSLKCWSEHHDADPPETYKRSGEEHP